MSASKTERLLNLLIALLERRRGYSKEELRALIPPYKEASSEEAFNRLFERDKDDLREMGIPVQTFTEDAFFDLDSGVTRYRIDRDTYRLPELSFTPEESAVLSLASRIWQQASLGSAAARAVRRLDVRGALAEGDSLIGIEPRIRTAEPAFDELLKAVMERYPVSFEYRAASSGEVSARRVEPWGLGNRFGHWYLVGNDLDRGDERTFRLTRISSKVKKLSGSYLVPEEFTMRSALESLVPDRQQTIATLLLRQGHAHSLRTTASTVGAGPSGWDTVTCRFGDIETFAEEVASHGANAYAVDPIELKDAVIRRFNGALDSMTQAPPSYDLGTAARPARTKSSSLDRLPRLLDLVSYVSAHPGAPLNETAEKFGVSPDQLGKDLSLLFVCGAPGYGPDQLIDAYWEDGSIYIGNADEIAQPVRLSIDEALSLVVGLQALETVPGVGERSALRSALSKLLDATGGDHGLHRAIAADFDADTRMEEVLALQDAVAAGETLTIEYLVPSRDEMTVRDIDPVQVFAVDGHWYTEAWCHGQQAIRQFRADRIRSLRRTGQHFQQPAARSSQFPQALFTPRDTDELVVLKISSRLAELAEHYNAERRVVLDNGDNVAELRLGSTAIITPLVARHGGEVTILEPASLALTAREWLAAALELYSENSKLDGLDS